MRLVVSAVACAALCAAAAGGITGTGVEALATDRLFAVPAARKAAAAESPFTVPATAVPTPRQMDFMRGLNDAVSGMSMFSHFGLPSFWLEGDKKDPLGTYHDCVSNAQYCDEASCGEYAPCLKPQLFNPSALNASQWVEAALATGFQEICLTAQHEGGFALWPSAYTNYSVANAAWKDGKGDVLAEFVAAANEQGLGICYYVNVDCDHYFTKVLKLSAAEFERRELGMLTEILTKYGPVNRLWFDGTKDLPRGLHLEAYWTKVLTTIRTLSPETLITGYRTYGGDLATSYHSLLRLQSGPPPNSTSTTKIGKPSITGDFFAPAEQVGICMEEGPDGNSNTSPTYWFWHPCVNDPTCQNPGHANASRLWHDFLNTAGHSEVPMINIPVSREGTIPPAFTSVMNDFGAAIQNTFGTAVASVKPSSAAGTIKCDGSDDATVVLDIPKSGMKGGFDFVETKEDLMQGQSVNNYTVDFQTGAGGPWTTLVPPVLATGGLQDRPAGTDPRDQYIGFRRIDLPVIPRASTTSVTAVRFRCLSSGAPDGQAHIASLAVYKQDLPWEGRRD